VKRRQLIKPTLEELFMKAVQAKPTNYPRSGDRQ